MIWGKKMKVGILTTVHPAFDARIFYKEAKSLARVHEVVLIAPSEEEINKEVDNVRIITIKKPKSEKLLHPITMWRVFKVGFTQDCDVYHCHEPDSVFIGILLKILKRKKVIYDVHEYWPSGIAYGWLRIKKGTISKIIQKIILLAENRLSVHVDGLISVSEGVAERFKYKEITIIQNVPVLSILDSVIVDKKNMQNSLVYASGSLQSFDDIYDYIKVLLILKKKFPNILLKIVGGKSKEKINDFINDIKDLNNNVTITGFLPYDEMYKEINNGCIGLSIFKFMVYNDLLSLPNKFFDYMACELPVIASNFPEMRRIVEEENCGILVDPTNIDEIANAITYLLEHPKEAKRMGKNGRRAVEEKYNWEKMEEKLFELYEGLK